MKSSPRISVILPVFNEEENLPSAIHYLRKTSTTLPTEIIVVDGGSTDQTKEIARQSADQLIESPKPGRATQMHLGAQKATGDLLLFLHADSRLPPNWQEVLLKTFFSPSPNTPSANSPLLKGWQSKGLTGYLQTPLYKRGIVAAAFSLAFDSDKLFYTWLAYLANLRTKIIGIPHGDQALVMHRETYFSSGGFPDVPLMEEYLFVPRLKRMGKIQILPEKVKTSCRKYELNGPLRNSLKNTFLILLFYLGVSPHRLARYY